MRPDITKAQILAAVPVLIGAIAKLLSAFGVYELSVDQQDAINVALGATVTLAFALIVGDAHLRSQRNKADALIAHATLTAEPTAADQIPADTGDAGPTGANPTA